MPRLRATSLLIASLCSLVAGARAQSAWTGGAADGNWETAGNWDGGVPTATDAAIFSATVASANASILAGGTDRAIQDLQINAAAPQTYAGTIAIGAGRTLTLRDLSWSDDGTASNPVLSVAATGLVVIQRSASVANTTGNRITNSGTIRFTNTSGGTATWSSSAVTSWGNVDVNAGSLLQSTSNITVQDLSISGGTLEVTAGTLTVTGTLTISAGATLRVNGGTLSVTGASTVDGTLDVDAGTLDLNGNVSGTGAITPSGGALELSGGTIDFSGLTFNQTGGTTLFDGGATTLTLAAASDTFAATTVNLGAAANVLAVGGAGTFDTTSLTVTRGIVDLNIDSDFSGAVSVPTNGTLRNDNVGSLTHTFGNAVTISGGAFTFTAASSNLRFPVQATGDVSISSGTFTVNGTGANRITMYQDGTSGGSRWRLVVTGGTVSVDRVRLQDADASPAQTASQSLNDGNVVNWSVSRTVTYTSAAGGAWSVAGNWLNSETPIDGDAVTFQAGSGGTSAVDIAGLDLASLDMTNFGGTLRLDTGLTVSGALTVISTLNANGQTLTVTGATTVTGTLSVPASSTVSLNGGISGAGTVSQAGGTVQIPTASVNLQPLTYTATGGALSLNGGAQQTLQVDASVTLFDLTVGASGAVMTGTGTGLNVDGALTLNGDLTLSGATHTVDGAATIANNRTLATNGQSLTVTGLTTITGPSGQLSVATGGTINLNGGIAGAGVISQSAGTINVPTASVSLAALASFTATGGTFSLNGGAQQTLVVDAAVTFFNLTVGANGAVMTGSNAGLDVDGTLTLTGSLTITAGGNTGNVANLAVGAGATLTLGAAAGENLTVATAFTTNATGVVAVGARTLTLNGAENPTVDHEGTITAASGGVVQFTNGYSTNDGGDLTMNGGTLRVGGTAASFTNAACALTFTAGGTLDFIGGTDQTPAFDGNDSLQGLSLNKGASTDVVSLGATAFAGAFTITTGTLDLTANRTISGAVTIGASGVLFSDDASRAVTFSSTVSIFGVFDFDANVNDQSLSFTTGAGGTVTVQNGGSFLVNGGASGTNQTDLQRVGAAGQWNLTTIAGGTVTVRDANISNSNASPAQSAVSSSDVGGNTGWSFGAKTTTFQGTGAWSNDANWSDGAPVSLDTVNFDAAAGASTQDIAGLTLAAMDMSGYTDLLTLTQPLASNGNVIVSGSLATEGLDMNGQALTVGGTLTINSPCTLSTGAGTLTVTGTTTVNGVLASALNGVVDLNGDVTTGGAGTRQIAMGQGTLRFGGANVTLGNLVGGLTTTGPTFFDRGLAQTLATRANVSFQDVTQTAGSAITISGGSGGLVVAGTLTLNANLNLGVAASSAGTLTLTSGAVDMNGQGLTAGTFTGAGGTSVTTDAGTFNVTTSFGLLGTITGSGGTVDVDADILAASTTGTFTMGSGLLLVSGATVDLSAATVSWAGGTLRFDGGNAQAFAPPAAALANLSLQKSLATDTVSLGAGTTVGSALTLTTGTLSLPAATLTVTGTTSSGANGRLTTNGGTLLCNGATNPWDGVLTATGGIADLNGTVDGAGSFTIGTGLLRCSGATVDLGTIALTFAAGGGFTLDGGGNQTVTLAAATTLQALTLSKGAGTDVVTLGGAGTTTVSGTTTLTTGILDLTKAVNFAAISIPTGSSLRSTTASLGFSFGGNVTLGGEFRFEASLQVLAFGPAVALNLGGVGSSFVITGGLGVNRTILRQDGAAGGAQWNLNRAAGDTVTVTNARIQDGFVSAATTANSSVDDLGNTNWVFGAKTTTWTNGLGTNVWSADGNWDNDRPVDGDTVLFSVTAAASNVDLAGLDLAAMNMTGYTGVLTLLNPLHVTGATTLAGTVLTNGQALTLDAGCTIAVGGNTQVSSVLTVGGSLEVDGTLTGAAGGAVDVAGDYLAGSIGAINLGAQQLAVTGATVNLGTTTWTSGVLLLQGGNAQALTPPGAAITTLTVGKTAGTIATLQGNGSAGTLNVNTGTLALLATTLNVTGAGTVQAAGAVTASTGTLQINGAAELDGQVTFTGAATLDLNGNPSLGATSTGTLSLDAGSLRCAGDTVLTGLAALSFTSGGVILDTASSPQAFTPTAGALANLTLQKGAAGNLVNLQSALGISGALTVTTGTLVIGTQTVTLSAGAGTPFSLGGGGSFTMAATGTVSYTGNVGPVTVLASAYAGNLSIGSGAAGDFTFGTGSVAGTLTLAANASLTVTDLTLSGGPAPLQGTGVFTTAGGIVRYTNAGAVTLAATTYPNLTLTNGTFTQVGTVTVAQALTIGSGTLTPGAQTLSVGSVSGAGTLNVLNSTLRLTTATAPLGLVPLNIGSSSVEYTASGAQIRSSDAPTQLTYGNLVLSGGGVPSLTGGGTRLYVSGNLGLVNTAFPGTIEFEAGPTSTFACGSTVLNLASLVVDKLPGQTLSITGADFIARTIQTLTINRGTLSVACDLTIVQGTVGTAGAPGTDAELVVATSGVDLTIGDGGARLLTVNDVFRFSQPAISMRLILAVTSPAVGAQVVLADPAASLTFVGIGTNQVLIESNTLGVAGRIARAQPNGAATITALHVSVRDNDASGVLDTAGQLAPIVAGGTSIDRGNTPNWSFTGGGALRIAAATALGDGEGSIDRVRLVYAQALDPATVGNVFQQFTLRQLAPDPSDPPLQTITGTAASVVISQNDNVLEIVFGDGLAKTDVGDLEVRYAPPQSGFLASSTGIPATLAETISPATTPPLRDGAPPVVINAFFQDVDGNGAHDRLNFFCSEPVAFSPARGTSVSGFGGVTSTVDLGANTFLTLQVAGDPAVAINLTPGGVPRLSGDQIAARIQEAVRGLVSTNPVGIGGHDPLRRPAYSNFTCSFTGGRYLLRAGAPLLFDAGTGTYRQDWAGSTVVVVAGGSDAAPQLRLGAQNGGVERAGSGDGRTGLSVSAPVNPDTIAIAAGTDAIVRLAGEDLRTYNYGSNTTTLEAVALVLETLVRASTNEAQCPPNQTAYSDFVAVPDRARGRLVLVAGQALGAGSRVEVASGAFATAAAIGSANFGAGASEPAGAANTLVGIGDLNVRGQDGSNLLLGKTAADLTIAGSVVTVSLANDPAAGLATPSFSFSDDGDGGFLCDRAQVLNGASGGADNLPAGSPVVLVGDTDGDLQLTLSPGSILLDASQSLLPLGTNGVSASFSWDYVSGPGAIVVGGVTLGPPFTGVASSPAFSFAASTSTTSASYVFRLTVTLLDGAGQPVINALTDQSGRIVTTVTVNVNEDAPVAVIVAPPLVVGSSAQLDGSGSFDPNGGAITFQWSANDSLGLPVAAGAFDDPTLARPLFMPAALGVYTVTVTVRKVADPTLTASASASLSLVDAGNFPPFADAGNDLTGRVNALISLDGSRSLDPEGTALTFAWTPVTLAAPAALSDPTSSRPTFTPIVPGAYTWRLTVTETSGQTDSDEVTVVVIDDLAPQPRLGPAAEPRVAGLRRSAFLTQNPQTTAGVPPVIVLERGLERTVTLIDVAADPSDDPAPGATTGLIGVHTVVGTGLFASYYAPPQPGDGEAVAIRFGPGQTDQVLIPYGVTGQAFVLDGTRSQDDGVIASFTWRQVSGPFQFSSRSGNLLAVVPQTAGTYVFELTVTDNVGLTSLPRQVTVPVVPAGNPAFGPPSAVTGAASGSVAAPATAMVFPALTVTGSTGQSVSLQASASLSRNGGNLTFLWQQVSGPLATLTGADTATVGVTAKAPGAYQLRLTVTDQNGVSASELVWVTFGAPGRPAPVARLTAPPTQVLPAGGVTPLDLVLDGAASTGDGPLQYLWSQARGVPLVIDTQAGGAQTGSTQPTSSPAARIRLSQPGTYELVLQVTDANGVTSAPAAATFEVQGAADPALSSGASFKESSGGCALEPGRGDAGGAASGVWPLLGLALLALARRRRGA